MTFLRAGFVALCLACLGAPQAAAAPKVSVQPFEGPVGPSVRSQIVRLCRGRGFRVTTALPRATGTGQYFTWARDHRVAAFVAADLESVGSRHRITFLIWNGEDGAVIGRWSVSATTRRLGKTIARDFWKRLGPALERAQAPPSTEPTGHPAPLHIDASSPYDRVD